MAHPATSDRNFYDRYFFNGYLPEGEVFFGAAMGLYPNRRVIDAAFSVVHNGRQKNLYVWAELRSNAVKRRSVPSPSKW